MARKIIMIDDDPDTLTYMSTILMRGGYEVVTAPDGHQGWRLIQEERPDLILLDIMMPRQSGIHLLSEMRKYEDLRSIPVIIVSGVGQLTGVDWLSQITDTRSPEDINLLEYIEKPIKPDNLLRAVREALSY